MPLTKVLTPHAVSKIVTGGIRLRTVTLEVSGFFFSKEKSLFCSAKTYFFLLFQVTMVPVTSLP